nr:polyribonucleotide nucleotidyltransferase [Bacteriovoracaceae bacterium]
MATRKEFRLKYGKNEIVIETGWLAKQADGSVMITCGGTQVLTTACSARTAKDGQDFFPLTVDYREKFYAAGKFLGGFFKREARPSNREILTSRIIDRPLRPLFPEGYMAETTIQSCVHSYDGINDAEILAGLSASAALVFSDIPFAEPVGFCKVGRIAGNLVLNPTQDQWKDSDLELVVAGSKNAILMVEGEGDEIP